MSSSEPERMAPSHSELATTTLLDMTVGKTLGCCRRRDQAETRSRLTRRSHSLNRRSVTVAHVRREWADWRRRWKEAWSSGAARAWSVLKSCRWTKRILNRPALHGLMQIQVTRMIRNPMNRLPISGATLRACCFCSWCWLWWASGCTRRGKGNRRHQRLQLNVPRICRRNSKACKRSWRRQPRERERVKRKNLRKRQSVRGVKARKFLRKRWACLKNSLPRPRAEPTSARVILLRLGRAKFIISSRLMQTSRSGPIKRRNVFWKPFERRAVSLPAMWRSTESLLVAW